MFLEKTARIVLAYLWGQGAVVGSVGVGLEGKYKHNRDHSQDHEHTQELISNNRMHRFSGHARKKVEDSSSGHTGQISPWRRNNGSTHDVGLSKLVLLICIRPEEKHKPPASKSEQETQHTQPVDANGQPESGYGCNIL